MFGEDTQIRWGEKETSDRKSRGNTLFFCFLKLAEKQMIALLSLHYL